MTWFLCAVCGRQGTSGVHLRVSYGDMDLGVKRMLLLVAGNVAHNGTVRWFLGIIQTERYGTTLWLFFLPEIKSAA